MADEGPGSIAGSKLPETEGLIPGRGESVGTVRRDDLCIQLVISRSPSQTFHTQSETIWE